MKRLFICVILFLALLLTACQGVDLSKVSDQDMQRISDKLIVCNPPYIRFASECCLDQNNNSICDKDEAKPVTTEPPATTSTESTPPAQNTEQPPQAPSTTEPSVDLAEYPSFFLKGANLYMNIVVGNKTPTSTIMAAVDIAAYLQTQIVANSPATGTGNAVNPIALGLAIHDTSVSNVQDNNYLVIGDLCDNQALAQLYAGTPEYQKAANKCTLDIGPDKALLQLFDHNGKIQLAVVGGDPNGIIAGSQALSNPQGKNLHGTKMIVTRATAPAVPTCTDRIKNQDETDADCGGNKCLLCKTGKSCLVNDDCASAYCLNKVCTIEPAPPANLDLSDYPEFFWIRDHTIFKQDVIAGSDISADETMAAGEITYSLIHYIAEEPYMAGTFSSLYQKGQSDLDSVGAIIDTDYAGDPTENNLIIVGNPCTNTVMREVLSTTPEYQNAADKCHLDLGAGTARIQIIQNGEHIQVLVIGYSGREALGAAYVLSNYADYAASLKATSVKVIVPDLANLVVQNDE